MTLHFFTELSSLQGGERGGGGGINAQIYTLR